MKITAIVDPTTVPVDADLGAEVWRAYAHVAWIAFRQERDRRVWMTWAFLITLVLLVLSLAHDAVA